MRQAPSGDEIRHHVGSQGKYCVNVDCDHWELTDRFGCNDRDDRNLEQCPEFIRASIPENGGKKMKSDIQIAHENSMMRVSDVFKSRGLYEENDDFETYGKFKAKMTESGISKAMGNKPGKLVLVTAISPTPAGEGKTTTSIGLADGLNSIGVKATLALREPSMGPVFGIKGGACGGGYAQVQPMEDINLHFMGDFHAITSANNLLCALVDNSIKFGNPLELCVNRIRVKRCLDVNDRELRNCVIGLGGDAHGVAREERFQITVASEIMAIVCLAEDMTDLKTRLGNIVVGHTKDGTHVFAKDLGCVGALATVLKDAIRPNLAQTLEHSPAIIHGGPFANIAHGCNSVRATKLAMRLGDVTVTEAGFGADLGAEKFIDIKCRQAGIYPDCIVLVATIRALKYNGHADKESLSEPNVSALIAGLLGPFMKHYENLAKFGVPIVVAVNEFDTDTEEEKTTIKNFCASRRIAMRFNTSYREGSSGSQNLAYAVQDAMSHAFAYGAPRFLYPLEMTTTDKVIKLCRDYYGAQSVDFSKKARSALRVLDSIGLPICVAKTQYSFSDDPKKIGATDGFAMTVEDVSLSNGAGFVVIYMGDIVTMPGLPEKPAALSIDVSDDGVIEGLF